jgi:radical SAM protein with 4Fe4S-binding SPASM domain
MSLSTLDKALDVLRWTPEGVSSPKRSVQFFGGEPLVDPAVFRSMATRIREREAMGDFGKGGIGIHLLTNGTLLDEATVEFLVRSRVLLSISLDGPRRCHDRFRRDPWGVGTHARVLAGISLARNKGLDVSIETVVTDLSAQSLERFVISMRDRFGIESFHLNFLIGVPKWQKAFGLTLSPPRLAQVFGRLLDIEGVSVEPLTSRWHLFAKGIPVVMSHSCMDGGRLVVYPDGGAAPCPACGWESHMPCLAPIDRLVGTAFWKRFSSTRATVDPSCYTRCALVGFCDGGCPLNAMSLASGDRRPECTIAHAMLECFVWRRSHRLDEPLIPSSQTCERAGHAHRRD